MTDQRPDPDALLRELKLKEETRTGKLKIFFGYAAGVGKTYAMLEAAHHAKEMGRGRGGRVHRAARPAGNPGSAGRAGTAPQQGDPL